MKSLPVRLAFLALGGLLSLAAMSQAGPPGPMRMGPRVPPSIRPYYGPYSPYGPGFANRQFFMSSGPFGTFTMNAQTTVVVPDGGTAFLGGYSSVYEGRNEFGTPVLGKIPYLGRGFNNVGYGRSISSHRIFVGARIIDLAEEEFRQTGVGR